MTLATFSVHSRFHLSANKWVTIANVYMLSRVSAISMIQETLTHYNDVNATVHPSIHEKNIKKNMHQFVVQHSPSNYNKSNKNRGATLSIISTSGQKLRQPTRATRPSNKMEILRAVLKVHAQLLTCVSFCVAAGTIQTRRQRRRRGC